MALLPVALSVSVALCTHNGKRFIVEQLRSILDQSVLPSQIVVSDDDSSDETMSLVSATIAEWRAVHPDARLEVTTLTNSPALGVTRNFERAILATTGDLVALSDQDDRWPTDRLARMLAEFRARPTLTLLHTDAYLVDEAGARGPATLLDALEVSVATRSAVHAGVAFTELLKRNIVTGATTVFRRSLVEAITPFPDAWLHDEWLAIAAAATGQVDLLEEPLLDYRQHGTNQVGAERLTIVGKFRRMIEPGAERSGRLLARAEQLARRLEGLDVTEEQRQLVRQKLLHEQVRSSLSPNRVRRLVTVGREWLTGRYGRFGRGAADALRDLIQPL